MHSLWGAHQTNLSFDYVSPKRKLYQRKGAKVQGQTPKKFAPDWARANFFLKKTKPLNLKTKSLKETYNG